MKKQVVLAFMMLSLMVTLAVTTATAQSSSQLMRITIPFEFAIRDKTLPPGEYTIKRSFSGGVETLLIRGVDDGSGVYFLTSNVQAKTRQSESKLTFHRYGDQYFLAQVWTAEDSAGREVPKCGSERALDRQVAKNTMKRQAVTLLAHRR